MRRPALALLFALSCTSIGDFAPSIDAALPGAKHKR